ncbi:hypothetical protein [Nostoc sp. TCL26-01]|nr:hypothetical protein [Nostoc sp. TCL26-01]
MRHQLCKLPQQWAFSSIHRFIEQKIYPLDWGGGEVQLSSNVWDV